MSSNSKIKFAIVGFGNIGKRHAQHILHNPDADLVAICDIDESKKNNETQIFIETPYRNQHIFNALIENLKKQPKLCIGLDITSENEFILTKSIADWKKEIAIDLKNKPCVFLLQS